MPRGEAPRELNLDLADLRTGSRVKYWSSTKNRWVETRIHAIDGRRVQVKVKRGVWLAADSLRRSSRSPSLRDQEGTDDVVLQKKNAVRGLISLTTMPPRSRHRSPDEDKRAITKHTFAARPGARRDPDYDRRNVRTVPIQPSSVNGTSDPNHERRKVRTAAKPPSSDNVTSDPDYDRRKVPVVARPSNDNVTPTFVDADPDYDRRNVRVAVAQRGDNISPTMFRSDPNYGRHNARAAPTILNGDSVTPVTFGCDSAPLASAPAVASAHNNGCTSNIASMYVSSDDAPLTPEDPLCTDSTTATPLVNNFKSRGPMPASVDDAPESGGSSGCAETSKNTVLADFETPPSSGRQNSPPVQLPVCPSTNPPSPLHTSPIATHAHLRCPIPSASDVVSCPPGFEKLRMENPSSTTANTTEEEIVSVHSCPPGFEMLYMSTGAPHCFNANAPPPGLEREEYGDVPRAPLGIGLPPGLEDVVNESRIVLGFETHPCLGPEMSEGGDCEEEGEEEFNRSDRHDESSMIVEEEDDENDDVAAEDSSEKSSKQTYPAHSEGHTAIEDTPGAIIGALNAENLAKLQHGENPFYRDKIRVPQEVEKRLLHVESLPRAWREGAIATIWKPFWRKIVNATPHKMASGDSATQTSYKKLEAHLDGAEKYFVSLARRLLARFQHEKLSPQCSVAWRHCFSQVCIKKADVERYRVQYRVVGIDGYREKLRRARMLYQKALTSFPQNGHAWNQMAVLAAYQKNVIDQCYYYFRAKTAVFPFSAGDNLMGLFSKFRAPENEKDTSNFINIFFPFLKQVLDDSSSKQATTEPENGLAKVSLETLTKSFAASLKTARFTAPVTSRILLVSLFALVIEATSKKTKVDPFELDNNSLPSFTFVGVQKEVDPTRAEAFDVLWSWVLALIQAAANETSDEAVTILALWAVFVEVDWFVRDLWKEVPWRFTLARSVEKKKFAPHHHTLSLPEDDLLRGLVPLQDVISTSEEAPEADRFLVRQARVARLLGACQERGVLLLKGTTLPSMKVDGDADAEDSDEIAMPQFGVLRAMNGYQEDRAMGSLHIPPPPGLDLRFLDTPETDLPEPEERPEEAPSPKACQQADVIDSWYEDAETEDDDGRDRDVAELCQPEAVVIKRRAPRTNDYPARVLGNERERDRDRARRVSPRGIATRGPRRVRDEFYEPAEHSSSRQQASPPRALRAFPPSNAPVRSATTKHSTRHPLIVVDAANAAIRHGGFGNKTFSTKGIELVIEYYRKRNHKVLAFLPEYLVDRDGIQQARRENRRARIPDDLDALLCLMEDNLLCLTPPQDYDDLYCIKYAQQHDGCVVTNDMYRDYVDMCQDRRAAKEWVKTHCISFTFATPNEFLPNPQFRLPPSNNGPVYIT